MDHGRALALGAPRPCASPRCSALVQGATYCPDHAKARAIVREAQRENAAARGYGHKWREAREGYLRAHPLCASCSTDAVPVMATVVDHIIPHKGDRALFWQRSNWQGLCKPCHDRKTAREDGGFGR